MFNIPNIFTASNLLSGCLSIIFALCGKLDWACYFIFLGAAFDFFDGFLARLLKQQGEFGKQMDSLADVVTFGVAPGILIFSLLAFNFVSNLPYTVFDTYELFSQVKVNHLEIMNIYFHELFSPTSVHGMYEPGMSIYVPFIALFIPFLSIFRLAKFNLDTRQTENFIGLNTPSNAIFFTSFPLIYFFTEASEFKSFYLQSSTIIVFVIGMSLLLVSELPLFSLKIKKLDFKSNKLRYITAVVAILSIIFLKLWAIPLIILFYIAISTIDFIFAKKLNK